MDMISLMTIAGAFFAIAISPGPANLSNAAIAMSRGRKASVVYAFGLTLGLLIWGIVAASGLGAVLQTSIYLLMILKVLGGAYLIWLAYLSAKSALIKPAEISPNSDTKSSYTSWFSKGLILNLSNPKTVVAWMAALSVGLSPSADFSHLSAGVVVCVLSGFIANMFYSLCFSMSFIARCYRRIYRQINVVFSAVYGIAGMGLIKSAFSKDSV